jgi:PKD repeat protein
MLAFLIVPVTGIMGPAREAIDLPGYNINDGWITHVNSKEACAELCDANPNCLAATYVVPGIQGPEGHCWLKNPVPAEQENFNCYSFYKIFGVNTVVTVVPGILCIAPTAEFSSDLPLGSAPVPVQFTDQSIGAVSWMWDFGDGATSFEKNPVHIYTAGSTQGIKYTVKLTVTGSCPTQTDTKIRTDYITVYDNVGGLDLTSVPSGAKVYFDSQDLGTTPSQKFVPTGTHLLRLTMKGYQDYTAQVTITKNQMTKVTAALIKVSTLPATTTTTSSATGTLQITTTPVGAAVFVDGGSQGISPKTVSGLAAGSHTVKLTKAGYVDYQGTVMVLAGQTTPMNVNMVVAGSTAAVTTTTGISTGTGSISVTSSPTGASVNLDGWDKGTTPVILEQVKAGSHTITLKKTGFEDSVHTVTVTGGGTAQVKMILVPADRTGQPSISGILIVSSTPAGSNVYLDGERVGMTPVRIPDVRAGTHRLVLTLQNYNDIARMVEVIGGTDNEVSVEFPVEKETPGFGMAMSLAAVAFSALVMLRKKKDH